MERAESDFGPRKSKVVTGGDRVTTPGDKMVADDHRSTDVSRLLTSEETNKRPALCPLHHHQPIPLPPTSIQQ